MVLVRTEAGQLALVPQQVLAQAKAQNQNKGTLSPRPATPTAGTHFQSHHTCCPGMSKTGHLKAFKTLVVL